jgi:5-histidylcysteine sulfoxide synthase
MSESDCKFSDGELLHTRTILLTGTEVGEKREEIRSYFHRTFSLYEALFDLLTSDAAFYQQPDALRHPLLFYFGHTAVFFVNKLVLARLMLRRLDAHIESLCAIGVDEMSWDDVNPKHYDWPTVAALRDYRDQVRIAVDRIISNVKFTLPIDWQSPMWPILMGIEHERIHLETSSVLFRQLPLHHIRPSSPLFTICPKSRCDVSSVPPNRLVHIAGGHVSIGRTADDATYGWDNEYGQHEADVAPFQASAFLVSNAEFLQFVDAGGYNEEQWWGDEGWKYRQFRQLDAPLFWSKHRQHDGRWTWKYRTIAREMDMPWSDTLRTQPPAHYCTLSVTA